MTITEPFIDIPMEVEEAATCPAGHDFCAADCADGYHAGPMSFLMAERYGSDKWVETMVTTSAYVNDSEPTAEPVMIALIVDDGLTHDATGEVRLTGKSARQLAHNLLHDADLADPLPEGVTATSPDMLHVGDELLTDDGWQKVTGLMFFEDSDPPVQVFTPERDVDRGDGWPLELEDLVQVRRRYHGACAVQFVAPTPTSNAGGTK